MAHKPIQFKDICLSFPQKVCFENFSTHVHDGNRIAIIGRNGSGKSTLLKVLRGETILHEGQLVIPNDIVFGYVPQIVDILEPLSGSERLNKALTQALALKPDVLLLDEPTNHLDQRNRRALMRMLHSFPGTLVVVTHDVELLRNNIDILWHIDNEKVHVFQGNYDDYIREAHIKRASIEDEISSLKFQKKEAHKVLMKEQDRAKKSDLKGQKFIENRRWPTVGSAENARRAIETTGRQKSAIRDKREGLADTLSELKLPESLNPKFSLSAADLGCCASVSVTDGNIGFVENGQPLLHNLNFSISAGERIAITGDNGSGKSTLIKAILNDPNIFKSGTWYVPKTEDIGYLDQHYKTLSPDQTVYETIEELAPHWTHAEIRCHLNDFLFRKNEEISAKVSVLSGGEKAKLCLAQIAAKTPKLLILDEMTNNLDLETRKHVIQVLQQYPGTLIVISHDTDFLKAINVTESIDVGQFVL